MKNVYNLILLLNIFHYNVFLIVYFAFIIAFVVIFDN